ncbi:hypothetical protein M2271_007227 [Streptomyces sp. LBL]|uniref:hypothetical protein n=1 Tax=Streptomyces sp. LBL TaxID=2940562 RepID=UPI0024751477|nr:hypothetical protein [Streptomyces sp. LBL]MDH6629391.1 hypothetical protein [Streptomyces sp. LBL]
MSAPDPSPFATGGLFHALGPFVVLTATVTVDGETVTVQQPVDRAVWQHIAADPAMRAAYERGLRHRLAVALVARLAPAVTVHDPTPPGEAVSGALARADAAMRNQPAPEQRTPSDRIEETR